MLTQKRKIWLKKALHMGTVISIQVVAEEWDEQTTVSLQQALDAFSKVEKVCSRFESTSAIRQLSEQIGMPVKVPDILFETIRFALAVSVLTEGAFDPTIGRVLMESGFNRHYLTGEKIEQNIGLSDEVSYLDVQLDEQNRTILLKKPLLLDVGAVAKGFAIDLASKALQAFSGFVIDAGGDLFVHGLNAQEEPWRVGIRHPIQKDETIVNLLLTDMAICTSGSYERKSPIFTQTHHLIHPQTKTSPVELCSSTVLAPYAMMADALSTAAFILGSKQGLACIENAGLDGLLIDENLTFHMTQQMKRYLL